MSIRSTLGGRRQWIVYRKADKTPIRPDAVDPAAATANSNAQDPATWLDFEQVELWRLSLGDGYGVGIVLYAGCGIACVDIDGALMPDGTWSPKAQEVMAMFPHAYTETSQSGRGLHIFVAYTGALDHCNKNKPWHLELYSEKRFIGVTGTNARGDIYDYTAQLQAFAAEYFPPNQNDYSGTWTDHADPAANVPTPDSELIKLALKSQTTSNMFGSSASFRDLWLADVEALTKVFPRAPGSKSDRPYDASSADQALANHLSYWTGNNCQHTLDLMKQSKLLRDKWNREDYICGTVAKACATPKKWRQKRDPAAELAAASRAAPGPASLPASGVPSPPATAASVPAPPVPAGTTAPIDMNAPPPVPASMPVFERGRPGDIFFCAEQLELFKGYVYVSDIHRVIDPNGFILAEKQFNALPKFAGRQFHTGVPDDKPYEDAWDAFVFSKFTDFPKVRGMLFDPREVPLSIVVRNGHKMVNNYVPLDIPMRKGDASLFVNHVNKLLPNGDDAKILLCYLAAMVQYKGHKAAWSVFIQGAPGNGKSLITKIMEYCLGRPYCRRARASKIDGRFNAKLYGALMVAVDDTKVGENREDVWQALLPMITETVQEIEGKGLDEVSREVCFNFLFNSNHKDGLRKTEDDRRICPLFTNQQSYTDILRDGMDNDYFITLHKWLDAGHGYEIILHYLTHYDIDPAYNFAAGCIRAPRTTTTSDAIEAGRGGFEQDILEAVSEQRDGFCGGWLIGDALDRLADSTKRRINSQTRRKIVMDMGYRPHPGLPNDGRIAWRTQGGQRPRLYIKDGHTSVGVNDVNLIRQLFETAQAQAKK